MGGGSAGHVMPVVAVIDELAARHASLDIRFWCDRSFEKQSRALMKHAATKVTVETIRAGKFRRYYGASLLSRLTDLPTLVRNVIDVFIVGIGFFQSLIKLALWRPQVVFCKGGFVCLPVGLAARLLRIPLVLHDSDTLPGLTNRLLAPRAQAIATGSPLEYYNYPKAKTRYVGIPVKPDFRLYDDTEKVRTKTLFHLPPEKPLLVVVGGGLGSQKINDVMVAIAPQLIAKTSVVHICGMRQFEALQQKVPKNENYKLYAFLSDHLGRLLGAADVVVSRAGASAMAELAALGASVVIVPGGLLAGGHQLKNAKVYVDAKAAVMADETRFESEPLILLEQISQLLDNEQVRHSLSHALQQFAKPQAAADMADMIERAAGV